ncbi:hypothetical protein VTJ83DRAFT_2128 [Remersonia thermophila]|uniref:Inner nuclear membrane protein SRC1 n=1 Tax=Remersonia thermophila TaxID=72144 RepID=A0ABR4DIT6_9PEZI
MSDSENLEYLQEDFDPWSLTVPRLRSILVTHNIQYPSQAKKQQLIEIFNEQVVPQAKRILAARARAVRTSLGIVDADSQSTTSTDVNDETTMRPPPSVRRSRSPRKTTRIKHESEEPEHIPYAPPPRRSSPRKRSSRSASAQLASASDTDTAVDTESSFTARRDLRRTPIPKLEPPEEEEVFFKRTPETAGVFSDDNPFQSGANSPFTPAAKTPTNRRKTAAVGLDSALRQPPSTVRRRTEATPFETPYHDAYEQPVAFSRDFEVPFSRAAQPRTPQSPPEPQPEIQPEIQPDEEFTPDEQLALDQEEAAHPELAAARRAPQPTRRKSSLWTPLWVLATTLLVAYAAWYRQEKVAVGYCGLGREPTQLIPSSIQLPQWAVELGAKFDLHDLQSVPVPDRLLNALEVRCETCPPHAYCYEDFTARCEPDFILKPHPLSFGGLLPLPPTCEPDGEKVRRVQAVADKAVEELRERRAKYECGEPLEPEGEPLDSPSMDEQELKEILSKKRSKRMAAEEFDELWAAAIGEVKAREEVQVEQEEQQPNSETAPGAGSFPATKISSTSLARLPYACAVRRSVKLGLARHRLSIGGVILAVLLALQGRRRFLRNRAIAAQIPALVDEVLERLAAQKELAFDSAGDDDAFLFLPNLRDDVLRHIHSVAERERIWQRVRAVVEQNSNVRTGQREGRNGEVGRAWEWIGPSRGGAIGDGSVRKRRSGRGVSWGADLMGEADGVGAVSETPERRPAYKKWEEGAGRPVY